MTAIVLGARKGTRDKGRCSRHQTAVPVIGSARFLIPRHSLPGSNFGLGTLGRFSGVLTARGFSFRIFRQCRPFSDNHGKRRKCMEKRFGVLSLASAVFLHLAISFTPGCGGGG